MAANHDAHCAALPARRSVCLAARWQRSSARQSRAEASGTGCTSAGMVSGRSRCAPAPAVETPPLGSPHRGQLPGARRGPAVCGGKGTARMWAGSRPPRPLVHEPPLALDHTSRHPRCPKAPPHDRQAQMHRHRRRQFRRPDGRDQVVAAPCGDGHPPVQALRVGARHPRDPVEREDAAGAAPGPRRHRQASRAPPSAGPRDRAGACAGPAGHSRRSRTGLRCLHRSGGRAVEHAPRPGCGPTRHAVPQHLRRPGDRAEAARSCSRESPCAS